MNSQTPAQILILIPIPTLTPTLILILILSVIPTLTLTPILILIQMRILTAIPILDTIEDSSGQSFNKQIGLA